MTARERLPGRRSSETFDLEHAGMRYTVTISRDHQRAVRETFIANHKRGNASDVAARDCGILISLALQHGCLIETIAHALSRNSDGSASGVAGAVLDRVLKDAMTDRRGTNVALSAIMVPPNRMRRLRPEKVAELAESMQARGLLQPIILRPWRHRYMLVAGLHRYEATKRVGSETIAAIVCDGLDDADAALLAEIDENLIRADLSPAERALHLAERKRLYEKVHPETKHGSTGKGRAKSRARAGAARSDRPRQRRRRH
jgi:ParB/RepB/Spo0J family partition protein